MGQLIHPVQQFPQMSQEEQFRTQLTGQAEDARYRAQLLWSAAPAARVIVGAIQATAAQLVAQTQSQPAYDAAAVMNTAERLQQLTRDLAAADPKMGSDFYIGGIRNAAEHIISILSTTTTKGARVHSND